MTGGSGQVTEQLQLCAQLRGYPGWAALSGPSVDIRGWASVPALPLGTDWRWVGYEAVPGLGFLW